VDEGRRVSIEDVLPETELRDIASIMTELYVNKMWKIVYQKQ
jgi:hypothetical protein